MSTPCPAPQLPPFDHQPRPYDGPSFDEVAAMRQRYLSPALLTYYTKPLMIVEGAMQYLYDETGRRYLDGFGGIVTVVGEAGIGKSRLVEELVRLMRERGVAVCSTGRNLCLAAASAPFLLRKCTADGEVG